MVYKAKVDANKIGYDFGLKFGLKQVSPTGTKKDIEVYATKEDNVFYALFDDNDTDFEICCANNSKFVINFNARLGNEKEGRDFIVKKGNTGTVKALERRGKHLHFVGQDTEAGKVLVGMRARMSDMSYEEASVNCSRIAIDAQIEMSREEKTEFKKVQAIQALRRAKSESETALKRDPNEKITITIDYCDIYQMQMVVPLSTPIGRIKSCFTQRFNLKNLRFVYWSCRLNDRSTLLDWEIDDGAVIECWEEQIGGGCSESFNFFGERGVVCFNKKTDQDFGSYDKPFLLSKKYLVKGFTLELRVKPKYSLE